MATYLETINPLFKDGWIPAVDELPPDLHTVEVLCIDEHKTAKAFWHVDNQLWIHAVDTTEIGDDTDILVWRELTN